MKFLGGAETLPLRRSLVLAHQGGWDEILLVVGPLAVVGLLLWLANRRVSAQLDRAAADGGVDGTTDPGPSDDRDEAVDPAGGRKRDKPQR